MIKMIQQYGKLPGRNEVDETAMGDVLLMLRHLNDDNFDYFYPILVKQAIAGDFPAERVANLIDYHCLRSKPIVIDSIKGISSQLYGTISFPIEDSKRILVPVVDWEETERLRKEIGLSPLKNEMDKNLDLIYDLELFKQKFTRPFGKLE